VAKKKQPKCPRGHASVAQNGMCNIPACAHCDPCVTNNKKNPKGLNFGTPRDHKVGRWAREGK